ncbi:hypothetical protein PR048_015024 [Dryococelus australis]|uniref:Uncharacterized protein n=1 Tax=Dryococelus australis TaxID=614101 RepID=A0ABQ9HFT6_9NEOP|nr:hypothetical protein PR048_015024 [Dryococelus australis]
MQRAVPWHPISESRHAKSRPPKSGINIRRKLLDVTQSKVDNYLCTRQTAYCLLETGTLTCNGITCCIPPLGCGEVLQGKLVLTQCCTHSVHAAGASNQSGAGRNVMYCGHTRESGEEPITHVLGEIGTALDIEVSMADEGETRRVRCSAGMKGSSRKPANKLHPPARFSHAKMGATPLGNAPCLSRWEASSLTTTPPRPLSLVSKTLERSSPISSRYPIRQPAAWPIGNFSQNASTSPACQSHYSQRRRSKSQILLLLVTSLPARFSSRSSSIARCRSHSSTQQLNSTPGPEARRSIYTLLALTGKVRRTPSHADRNEGRKPQENSRDKRRNSIQPSLLASHHGFACENRAGRCRWSVVFSGISRSLRPFIRALLHNHLASPSSAVKTSLLRAAQISQLSSIYVDVGVASGPGARAPVRGASVTPLQIGDRLVRSFRHPGHVSRWPHASAVSSLPFSRYVRESRRIVPTSHCC